VNSEANSDLIVNEIYRKAHVARDRNFDGKFFVCVKTTGIVCRPSCPAKTPKEENVHYTETIYDALEKGFRPCLRCKPDVELEHYYNHIHGITTVNRALKKIYNGFLNYSSINDLAKSLDVSERYLRKLFVEQVGVPPVKIAKYHRSMFAKKMLLSSGSSITEIAYASGFRSLRQFNDVFKEVFSKSPTKIRKELALKKSTLENPTLSLKYDKSFRFVEILAFFRDRSMAGVEIVTEESYRRTFRTEQASGYFEVVDNPQNSCLDLKIHTDDIRCYMEIYNKVRNLFDLDRDFSLINNLFSNDKILSRGMIGGHTPRLPGVLDPFEFTIRAILGQQISVKAATTLASKIAIKTGIQTDKDFPEGLNYFFPNPEDLSQLDLAGIGITKTRQTTIQTVTNAVLNGDVHLTSNQTFEKFQDGFIKLKGIGEWTVNYVAMRGLGIVDAFPWNDLGVIKALSPKDKKLSKNEILAIAEKWRPYRTYAALCLWNSLQKEN
jgi:AraC family transcriptional regulator, regulatory protein of adaptative response / DNA-3-methyladenine glycosylase II